MNKTELIKNVAQSADISQKDASAAVQSVFDTIATALQSGDKVQLIGFGTFEVRERSARTGRNPQTGEEIQIAAGKVPAFKAGKELKEVVNKQETSHFRLVSCFNLVIALYFLHDTPRKYKICICSYLQFDIFLLDTHAPKQSIHRTIQ